MIELHPGAVHLITIPNCGPGGWICAILVYYMPCGIAKHFRPEKGVTSPSLPLEREGTPTMLIAPQADIHRPPLIHILRK